MTTTRQKSQIQNSRQVSMLGHIFGSHIERLGAVRTLAGGLSMYLCIPFLVVLQLTLSLAVFQWIFRPLLSTPRLSWRDYIIIDRQRYAELTWFDKFNCMFCGYANGLCTMLNIELDNFAKAIDNRGLWRRLLVGVGILASIPTLLMMELALQVIYNIMVSRPLGMHRVSIGEYRAIMIKGQYAQHQWPPLRLFLRSMKSVAGRFGLGLEQIESSWCPLTHFERRKGVVYPRHHDKFFGPNELEKMRETLRMNGTVSDRLPKL